MSLSLLLFKLHTNTVENHNQNIPGLPKLIGRTLNILKNHSSHNSSKKTLSRVSIRKLSELACLAVVSVFFKTSGASTKDARDKKEQNKYEPVPIGGTNIKVPQPK